MIGRPLSPNVGYSVTRSYFEPLRFGGKSIITAWTVFVPLQRPEIAFYFVFPESLVLVTSIMQISTHLLLALIFKAAWSHPSPHQLSKRVDPTTNIGWPEDDISQNHKARLIAAFPDIYRLVEEVTIAYPDGTYQSIWNKYFPPNDQKAVRNSVNQQVSTLD
jgi:hypothetical protein